MNQLKAMGEANRFRICMMLLEKPLCVCQLLSGLDIAGGTLSNHLKILKSAGLVEQRKDGKWIEYFIADSRAEDFIRSAGSYLSDSALIVEDRRRISCSNRESCSTI
ncbi:helix-turn-helix transcriptional regulator [Oceanispirochaeta sp.]|uniref:ArsR/SmtB family transcription factor n=1 Tax=Oceanispirochaeta sp. TaxID=2035350 RepID=UPI00262ADFB6|nr:metalloregulator ArsR/SmtB family transcription factor [Oceanispirochaeta sp.]MDA3958866.1 metalloregulator ArsR/SmtB family transcription factor [Oceanispirochaeta sp.]